MHPNRLGRLTLPAAFLLALVVMAVAPAFALAESPSPAASAAPLIYRVGLQSDVDNMNPFSTYNTIPWECFRVGYNFLTWYDADFKPVPDLATEVPTLENGGITDDGKVWTFHIRPNVKWSDGEPLTARDVAYTYNRILRQELGMYIGYFPDVTKVEAPDDHTVVITSKKPNAVMTALYVPILPEHVWSKVPDNKVESWANVPMVSSGPFHVTEVKNGKYVKMERNPYYKDGFGVEPAIDEVFFNMYQTQDGVVADYKAGNLDAAIELDPGFFQSLQDVPGSTSVAAPGLGFHELGMNCLPEPQEQGQSAPARQEHPRGDRLCRSTRRRSPPSPWPASPSPRRRCSRRSTPSTAGTCRPTSCAPTTRRRPSRSSTTPATRSAPTASVRTPRATSSSSGSRR